MERKKSLVIISSHKKSLREQCQQLLRYRELIWIFAKKDLRVRYAQTYLGFTWSFISPIIDLFVLTFVFQKLTVTDVGEIPHILFTLTGLIGWSYFAGVAQGASTSLIGGQDLIKKMYFPRLCLPLAKATTTLVNFIITFSLLLLLLIYFGVNPTYRILFLPLVLLINISAALGVGIWLSAATIRFRDIKLLIPVFLRIGMFLTPIAYSAKNLSKEVDFLYHINPMAGICEAYRWCILEGQKLDNFSFVSFGVSLFLLITGIYFFQAVEHKAADYI